MRTVHTLVSTLVLAVVLVVAIPVPAHAVSSTINYQGKLTTSANVAVPNGQYNMRFWLLTSPSIATTSAVWTESLTGSNRVQVTNGLFSVMLGSTTPLTSVDFSQTLYLGVEIGGTSTPAWDGEMSPRKLLGTVPAAFEAENAQTLDGIATSSFLRSDQDDTASGLLTFTGGFISSASSTITNLTTGIATTTTLVINNQAFTNLLGTGLTNQSGVLTVSTTTLGFGALAALNSIDISSHTNLGVTATGLTLSGDNIALSGGYTIPLTASTTEWSNKGNVSGPASATDNAIARFDLTTGKLIQDSLATISDTGIVTASSFIPSSATVPTNGMYLPAANTLGWGINSAAELRLSATELAPAVNDGLALGSTTLGFSDIFLASQAVMNWNNGNVTLTHEADKLSFEGASSGYIFSDGNVGIGSSTPSHLLTIAGDTNITGALRFNGSAGTTGQVLVSNGGSAPAWTATSSLGFSSSFSNSAQLAALLSDETGTAGSVVFSGGPTFTGNTTLANASTTNLTISGNAYLGTVQSGTWNGTDIDISDYTNLGVTATGLSLSGDNIALSGGYTIPLTASTTEWATAYGWGNHGSAGYLTTASIDTSSEIATIVTNEVGSGPLVFASSTVLTSPTIFGNTSMVNASTTALTVSTSAWLPSALKLGSNTFTRSGAHNLTLTTTGNTTVTLPTSGTLAALTSAMTGTFDGNNFAGGAVATGDILYGGSAGSIAELTIAASSSVLLSNGTTPVWGRIASSSLLTSTWTPGLVMMASSTAPGGLAWTSTSTLGFSSSFSNSAQLAALLSDETGTAGNVVFSGGPTFTGNTTLANASTTNLTVSTNSYLGTVQSGTWNGTDIDISDYTNLGVTATGLSLSGDNIALSGGYTIPLTASTTEWANKVSSQWTTNGSNIYYNTGNVGIGTTTPSYPLSVTGTAYVGNLIAASTTLTSNISHRLDVGVTNGSHGNPGILNVRSLGSDTSIGFDNDSLGEASIIFNNSTYGLTMEVHTPGIPVTIRPNGTMAGYFSDDGNVGIGTSTLQSTRLTVNGGMSLSGALLDSTRATGTVGMTLQSTGTSTRWVATSTLGFSSSFSNSAQLAALLSDETGTAGSVVFSGGPTFTGNTTLANASTTNLTISGNTYSRTILPETTLTYSIGSSAQRFNEGWISTLNIGTSTWSMTQSANGRFSLFDAASGGGNERLTVLSNGDVGIGTTSPLARLDVYGAAGSNPAFRVSSSTNATMFTVNANGNVGVGSTNPGARLEVVGDIISKGTEWTSRTSAADNHWQSVTYGNGLFVAVSSSGSSNRVMTSPDGTNWTTRTSAADRGWNSVTYGNGLFVAVANSGSTNRVMTSPDGITWTTRASTLNAWNSVTYGNGLFVAVSYDGSGNRVMTSPDGITWTTRTSAADNQWLSVTYGNGLFVAVSYDGSGNRVMTSPDGITWTIGTSATNNTWQSVTYGNGLFVAVADSGSSNRVMTSPDGITWTSRTSATSNGWRSVTYGNGLFVAVSESGSGDRVMTSPDGITWTTRTSAPDNSWRSVTYGNGLFVAVGLTGSSNRVMTSGKTEISALAHNNLFQGGMSILGGNTGIGTTSPSQLLTVSGTSSMRTILPETNLTYNIGSSAQRFNEGWISTLNLGTSTWSMTQSANGRFSLFDAASGGGTERFTVLTNGNVGIGTTTPANALHIQTAGAGEALTLQKTGTGWIGQNFIVGSKTWTLYNSSNISNQGFGVYDTTNSVYRFAIDGTDGNVGISTTSPLARLDVYGAAGSNPAFRVSSSTNTTMFTVNANGNVGIGTTSPQRALHVQISSDAPPVRFQDSNGYCEINPTTTTWSCTSDRRLKENIKSLDPASILANLSELRPVSFAWKTDANHEDRIGLIAQEVEEFFPDLVLTDSASGMKSVAYGGFTPYLIAGVQELVQTNRNLATLLMTGTSTFATSSPFAALLETEDSLWSRLMTLAENFMDGVLTLAGIRTDELCVGSVCIDEATFLQMVEQSGGASSAPSDPEDDEDEPPYIEDTENGTSTPEIEDETGSSTEDGTEETGESGEGTNPEGGEGGSAPEEIVPEPEPEEQVTEEDPPLVPEEDTEPVGGGSAETSGETGGTGV